MILQKYRLISDTIIHCETPEKMVKIIKRMQEMVNDGEMSWQEYWDLHSYRRIREADRQFSLKVIELLNN